MTASVVVVEIPEVQRAVGQAAILLSGDRRYFDAEMGAVLPRLLVAAQTRSILFVVDQQLRLVRSFAAYALLDDDCSVMWRHRLRTPSPRDVRGGDNAWLTDYSFATIDDGDLLVNQIKARHQNVRSVMLHDEPATYPEFRVVTLGGAK